MISKNQIPRSDQPIQGLPCLRSEKIQTEHSERLAIVYVRQSTPQQVLNHQESTRVQYSLKTRALLLGWSEDRILVIDDDLGKSGATAEGRVGFQRLVSEVSLGHVGLILGAEMSRLARSCKDWHQLLEVCGIFGTLIADFDGIYDPGQYNDRLLLGLKGTMSEAELHIIKQRMSQGRINKARRGELRCLLPRGYVRRPSGEVVRDPDEQVQEVVRLVFRKFEELGTLNAVLQYLAKNNIKLGNRTREGETKGELEWRRPNRPTLQNMLHNPIYAGAYAYGRRRVNLRKKIPGRPSTGRQVQNSRDWFVLIKDRFPAYISWDQYERNLERLKSNQIRADEMGAIRHGPSLLSGLLICGKCGRRMTIRYAGRRSLHSYLCSRQMTDYGGEVCQSLAGPALDQFVISRLLEALAPASLDLSLEAARNLQQEREEHQRLWRQRLERIEYEVDRAARQYRSVEPENRLVARQLEQEWETKLSQKKNLEEEYHRFEAKQPRILSEAEREQIRLLATDIPALWYAPTTTVADRKEIIRQVVNRVIVDTQGDSERVRVIIEWASGTSTQEEMIRPVRKLEQLTYYPQLCKRIHELLGEELQAREIANRLNAEGFHPPKRRETFSPNGIRDLISRLGLDKRRSKSKEGTALKENEWWLADLAQKIPMPSVTLYNWVCRGWVKSRREENGSGHIIIWADSEEIQRLKERHQRPQGFYTRRLWGTEPLQDSIYAESAKNQIKYELKEKMTP